jgi:hypothetical protein
MLMEAHADTQIGADGNLRNAAGTAEPCDTVPNHLPAELMARNSRGRGDLEGEAGCQLRIDGAGLEIVSVTALSGS